MLNNTTTTEIPVGDLLNPRIERWTNAQIAERVKQLRLLQLAEAELVRSRAISWVFTVLVCLLAFGVLLTTFGVLGRVFFLDWVLAGCR